MQFTSLGSRSVTRVAAPLVSISKRIREQGGELRLSGLNEDLRSLFELTKLDTLFAIADTPQQALASF
jgi:anti-sigma B factor antagonist